jgi:hypothetical protein
MILPYLDIDFLFYLSKKDLGILSLVSKYHNNLINKYWYPLAKGLLKDQGYKIFKYNNSISLILNNNKKTCISLSKNKFLILNKLK